MWACEEARAAQSAGMQAQIVVRAGNAPIAPEELNPKPTLQTITTFDAIDDALFKVPASVDKVPAGLKVPASLEQVPAVEHVAQKLSLPAVSAAAAAAAEQKNLSPRKRRVEAALPDEPKPKK